LEKIPVKQDLPLPQVSAFLVCNQILHDSRTKQHVLIGPVHHVPVKEFPARLRVSVYLQLRGGHGRYVLDLHLRDLEGDSHWHWRPSDLEADDPLFPHKVIFHDLVLDVPQAGRYELVVSASEQEVASQSLWIGPREVFTAD
jgi:hypothetical protein